MLTLYVRKLAPLCVLVLIMLSAPVFAEVTTLGGGSGGMAEVQNRLTGESGESPEIAVAKRHLLSVIEAKVDANGHAEWTKLIDEAAARPRYAMELPASEIVVALGTVADYLNEGGDVSRARKVLTDVAHPESIGALNNDAVRAVMQTLAYKSAGNYAKAKLHDEQVALPDKGLKTTELQRLYDKLTGTQKPLTIFKNDREFLMVQPNGQYELFADDTQFVVQTSGLKPTVARDDGFGGELRAPNVVRQIVLDGNAVIERTTVSNQTAKAIVLTDEFRSDFKDMFEVRGWKRNKRGTPLPKKFYGDGFDLSYKGLDGKVMTTRIRAAKTPGLVWFGRGTKFTVAPKQTASFELTIFPGTKAQIIPFSQAKAAAEDGYKTWRTASAIIETDNPDWNRMVDRGWKDLYMLKQRTTGGEGIAAGTPWFACPFGRDQLITSMQLLLVKPELARNVLKLLAHYQGKKDDAVTAERPGKIMHELRVGEMARNKEIPFRPYYGTVDATPLWVVLLGRYYERTGDVELVRELLPNLHAALVYMEKESAASGYLRYGIPGAKEALSNQGWKDSGDSVSNRNGELASPPVALSEVQGYYYEALVRGASLAKALGNPTVANQLAVDAGKLRHRFQGDFWMAKGFPALAVYGDDKQPADVVSSNAGHLLWNGMLDKDRSAEVADRLMRWDMFNGFGIKTLSAEERRHFENSYHNGSVWPHDVSIIAAGMHQYKPEYTAQLADGLLDAARYQNDFRLPELFGGYPRKDQSVPIPYPVACEPQAWAAGTPFLLLSACSGIEVNAPARLIKITHPHLPKSINRLCIKNLAVDTAQPVDLELQRTPTGTEVRVLSNPSKLNILLIP
jgi:glycogen debranching enzyme